MLKRIIQHLSKARCKNYIDWSQSPMLKRIIQHLCQKKGPSLKWPLLEIQRSKSPAPTQGVPAFACGKPDSAALFTGWLRLFHIFYKLLTTFFSQIIFDLFLTSDCFRAGQRSPHQSLLKSALSSRS